MQLNNDHRPQQPGKMKKAAAFFQAKPRDAKTMIRPLLAPFLGDVIRADRGMHFIKGLIAAVDLSRSKN